MQLKSRLPWTLVAELRRKGSPKGKASERRWVAEENLLPTFLWSGESHLGGRPPCQAVGFHLAPASEAGTRLPLLSQQLSWLTVQVPGLSPHSMDGPVPPHGLTSCLNRSAGPHCLLILLSNSWRPCTCGEEGGGFLLLPAFHIRVPLTTVVTPTIQCPPGTQSLRTPFENFLFPTSFPPDVFLSRELINGDYRVNGC